LCGHDVLPFEPREARVAFLTAPNGLPSRQVAITLVAREEVVSQYERLLGAVGIRVTHVAPAACHLFNLAGRWPDASSNEVHALRSLGHDSVTVILSQHGVPHYARTFLWPGGPEAAGAAQGADLCRELHRSFEHAAEEAGLLAPSRLVLAGEGGTDATLATVLAEGLGLPCSLPPPPPPVRRAHLVPPGAQALLAAALASR
jgi:Tfp pilus assembly PilM family ATPase